MTQPFARSFSSSGSLRRRSFLGLGLMSGISALLSRQAQEAQAAGAPLPRAMAKNVLIVFEQGGLSHIDTWDPKPEAVAEHRSPYKPVNTNVPGMQFTELLAKTSRHAEKLAVIRSMNHKISGHPEGSSYIFSGEKPGSPIAMPDIGTTLAHRIGTPCSYLPPYVMIPGNGEQSYNTTPGFLSQGLKAFKTTGSDLSDPKWRVPDLRLLDGIDERRFRDRRDLLSNLNLGMINNGGNSQAAMSSFYDQAFDLLTNPKTQAAFDLSRESPQTREMYGMGHRGQCYLLGRRLIEEGVRFVVLDVREPETSKTPGGFNMNWDHHDLIYSSGSCGTIRDKAGGEGRYGISHWVMMGSTDQAFAALLQDMDRRGLLKETLVCFVTEFGRTPNLNKFQGRDHWPNAYSIAFAGAGVRGGQIIGRTDRTGGEVQERPTTPDDYAATLYHALGVDTTKPIYTNDDRPVHLAKEGSPILELF